MRKLTKRLAVGAASFAAASTAMVAAGATPSYALATCGNNHICFYKDYRWDPVQGGAATPYFPAGTMSDQTTQLFKSPEVISTQQGQYFAYGHITNFKNSHYTDGEVLNDSVSFIVNNTAECLALWPDSNFQKASSTPIGQERFILAPHTSIALAGQFLAQVNDHLSSAATMPTNVTGAIDCPDAGYRLF